MPATSIHIGAKAPITQPEVAPKKIETRSTKQVGIIELINGYLAKLTPIKTTDKVSFFRLLATMINAGISIVKALNILVDQVENPHMKEIIKGLSDKIESGKSFSEAMAEYPEGFSEAQVGMIESGEASGRLNQTLLQIAQETEKSSALISKIKSAMIYPIVIIVLMLGAGFAVMTYVMPKIKDMFQNLGGELPASTVTLINISDFLVDTTLGIPNSALVLIVLALLVAIFIKWKKTKVGAILWAEAVFKFPVFGKLSRKVALARFCRSLSTMVSSGISIIKALRITATSVGNPVYERRVNQIAEDVKQGITMAENMKDDTKHFPNMVVGMIGVAEQTAQIDSITAKLADYYEEEVNDTVKGLSALLEPIILVVLGLAIGFLVISVMMPILSASDLASNAA
ncbi:type II secretion system F family protein [Patescibacteria group bacterium]|nr:type II secretion system F family protein [Patescibacteria group bacterium]